MQNTNEHSDFETKAREEKTTEIARELLELPKGKNKPLCWDMDVLVNYIVQANEVAVWEAQTNVPHTGTCEKSLGWCDVCDCGADKYNGNMKRFIALRQQQTGNKEDV